MTMRIARVRDGVSVISGFTNGNILAVETRAGVLLVDGQSAKRVGLADSALRTVTRAPVRWVVNTHYHGDHTEGNAHWRAGGAEVYAHRNVPPQMRKDTVIADWQDWHRTPAADDAMPTATFGDSLRLTPGGTEVVLLHLSAAHTDGDAIVWLPALNVLHTGDLVELGAFPFLDWWAGGTLDGMIAATERILAIADAGTAIVPGHGPVADRAAVQRYREMLLAVRDRLGAAARERRATEDVVRSRPLADYAAANGGERRAAEFVALAYYGLRRGPRNEE